jgi:hypothetical protein
VRERYTAPALDPGSARRFGALVREKRKRVTRRRNRTTALDKVLALELSRSVPDAFRELAEKEL